MHDIQADSEKENKEKKILHVKLQNKTKKITNMKTYKFIKKSQEQKCRKCFNSVFKNHHNTNRTGII